MLSKNELNMAGWASIATAIIAIPQMVFTVLLETIWERTATLNSLEILFISIYLVLFVFVYHKLKRLLNEHADFHGADTYIWLLIGVNLIAGLLTAISNTLASASTAIDMTLLASLIIAGIITIALGVKLLKCTKEFSGKLKLFAYLNITAGVMFATVLLVLFGFLVELIASIILALVFFSEVDANQPGEG